MFQKNKSVKFLPLGDKKVADFKWPISSKLVSGWFLNNLSFEISGKS